MGWWSECGRVIDPASLAGVWAVVSVLGITAALLLAWFSSGRANSVR